MIFAFLPSWATGDIQVGIAFLSDYNMKIATFGDEPDEHYVGILIRDGEGEYVKKSVAEPVKEKLSQSLREIWSHKTDMENCDCSGPLFRTFLIPSDGNFDGWAESIFDLMEELASKLGPALTAVATELNQVK